MRVMIGKCVYDGCYKEIDEYGPDDYCNKHTYAVQHDTWKKRAILLESQVKSLTARNIELESFSLVKTCEYKQIRIESLEKRVEILLMQENELKAKINDLIVLNAELEKYKRQCLL